MLKRASCIFIIWALVSLNGFSYEIRQLKKIGQIECATINQEKESFYSIDSYCFDRNGNIYIADSGLNAVVVFDKDGKQLGAFGRKGQGPGEFLGRPKGSKLDIVYGNDHLLYVTDYGNQRISVFKEDSSFLRSHNLPESLRDDAVVNRAGDIYLLSKKTDGKLIARYDRNMALKDTFFDAVKHAESRYFPYLNSGKGLSRYELRKALSADDSLIVCSNVALKIFVFDNMNQLIQSFDIDNEVFTRDFSERVKKLRAEKLPRGTTSSSILPFSFHLDHEGNIYLGYFDLSIGGFELYRYSQMGEFKTIYRFPEKVFGPFGTDQRGRFYGVSLDGTSVCIFK
jgi:hypothetical protein